MLYNIIHEIRRKLFIWWRNHYFKESISNDFKIFFPVSIAALNKGLIKIGKGCKIGEFSTIRAANYPIKIGNDVIISNFVSIISTSHEYRDKWKLIGQQGVRGGIVTIGNNCWLCNNCVILPRVTIGEGSIIAAGTIVTKDIPPYSIAAGNPAQIISKRV